MATSATSCNLPPDIIHEILVQVSDSSTLSAAIRVCSHFYNVFQARPIQILRTTLGNVAGPALQQAQRLAYCQTYLESAIDLRIGALLDEAYFQGGQWKPDRTVFMRMEEQARAVRILEDFYSLKHISLSMCQ
ncbi:hypothetical protein BD414DRAFT_239823 [Trametes punicea]|nr:hypothetical protein BD414DRAFT_239823 [Trametes punicea]